jgi:hypothetical protein
MWANAIPLVTLLAVVFGAGIFVSELRSVRRDFKAHQEDDEKNFEDLKKDFNLKISELKSDFHNSSTDQGRRIGELVAEQKAAGRAEEVRREFTGRHTTGRDE